MDFFLGFLMGFIFAAFILLTLTFFRSSIEKRIMVIEKQVMNAGPKPKGFIVEAEEESEVIRQEIINNNKKLGRSTKIEELE